ncbi:hypothetical protein WJX84_005889 [Apatococcus fuscideae]|uniref:Uncharacterized protein n=1 Tax=Apatococcus fuscideae TaxID=2026836 RepID=A0AAW1TGD7_9CHLO
MDMPLSKTEGAKMRGSTACGAVSNMGGASEKVPIPEGARWVGVQHVERSTTRRNLRKGRRDSDCMSRTSCIPQMGQGGNAQELASASPHERVSFQKGCRIDSRPRSLAYSYSLLLVCMLWVGP